jgi:hypothetical protein
MKQRTKWLIGLAAIVALLLSACGEEEAEQGTAAFEPFDREEYEMTLIDTDMQPVDVFATDQKTLYLYFTGSG